MKKHNRIFAQRWARTNGDRSAAPQRLSHQIANDKRFQLAANSLLQRLLGPWLA